MNKQPYTKEFIFYLCELKVTKEQLKDIIKEEDYRKAIRLFNSINRRCDSIHTESIKYHALFKQGKPVIVDKQFNIKGLDLIQRVPTKDRIMKFIKNEFI